MVDHLRASAAATDDELVEAGRARWSRRDSLIDVLRDRVAFGIHAPDGPLVGFTGRAAPNAGPDVPKYINLPATDLFTKGGTLFGWAETSDRHRDGACHPRPGRGCLRRDRHHLGQSVPPTARLRWGTALTQAQVDLLTDAAHQAPPTLSRWPPTTTPVAAKPPTPITTNSVTAASPHAH
ncbi:MAG: hypothetical protein ACK5MT_09505 [Actinomycetales bacterium]